MIRCSTPQRLSSVTRHRCKLGNFQLIKTLAYSNLFSFPLSLDICLRRRGRETGSGALPSLFSLFLPLFVLASGGGAVIRVRALLSPLSPLLPLRVRRVPQACRFAPVTLTGSAGFLFSLLPFPYRLPRQTFTQTARSSHTACCSPRLRPILLSA